MFIAITHILLVCPLSKSPDWICYLGVSLRSKIPDTAPFGLKNFVNDVKKDVERWKMYFGWNRWLKDECSTKDYFPHGSYSPSPRWKFLPRGQQISQKYSYGAVRHLGSAERISM